MIDQADVGQIRSLTLEQRMEFDHRGFLTITTPSRRPSGSIR
jgi:hypothetical protein